jgi:hypothetical protein
MIEKAKIISISALKNKYPPALPILQFFQFKKGKGEVYQICDNCFTVNKHRYDNSKCWCTKCGGWYALNS